MLYSLTGPSASGKTTLSKELLKRYPEMVVQAISTTSRPPRPNETDGVDYHFISESEFTAAITRGEFVEFAKFDGNYYGLRRSDIEKAIAADIGIVIVEKNGRNRLKDVYGDKIRCVHIGIHPGKALTRLINRNGWGKAKKRIKADEDNGLYSTDGYDCTLKNDSTKKELVSNFMNYVESVKQWEKLYENFPKEA